VQQLVQDLNIPPLNESNVIVPPNRQVEGDIGVVREMTNTAIGEMSGGVTLMVAQEAVINEGHYDIVNEYVNNNDFFLIF
jgi:hypothetical protein